MGASNSSPLTFMGQSNGQPSPQSTGASNSPNGGENVNPNSSRSIGGSSSVVTTSSSSKVGGSPQSEQDLGFVKRKGGKRPPKDPSLSVEERLARALQEQNDPQEQPHVPPTACVKQEGPSGSLVNMANRISVPAEERPTRRLRPKAPSSKASSVCSSRGSGSSTESWQSAGSNREPITLRTFELLKVLGKGSHGKVFLVRHRGNKQLFAMKQLKKSDVIASKQLENTKREFRVHLMLAQQEVQCPNIVPLRFAFHSRSRLYMVFDYCPGGELYFHIGQRGRLPEALARFYGAQIALALGYLHSNGIAYRDLKPENLLLDSDGNINLVDLGLCKDNMSSATAGSQSFCGTTEYLAPEILNYQEHGLAVDWWAFGMVLYEMLTGLPPWYSYKQEEVVRGILGSDLTFPAYVSEDARILICGLLCRDPVKRLGSKRGVEDIIDMPFFKAIDWVLLAKRELRAPFKPPHDDGDASNFDVEFTSSRIEAERDHVPPSSNDPFGRFYFDSEDPVYQPGQSDEEGDGSQDVEEEKGDGEVMPASEQS